jgi:hypothetical protein
MSNDEWIVASTVLFKWMVYVNTETSNLSYNRQLQEKYTAATINVLLR